MHRALLVGFIVIATVGFVIGTSIERHNARHESAAQLSAEKRAAKTTEVAAPKPIEGGSGESAAQHAAEGVAPNVPTEVHKELRPLGVDIEAVPFVVLAALTSLALGALGWLRPRWLPGLVVIAAAMVVFGALDIREVFHQSDESKTGLVVLAGAIAALHLAAAGLAGTMAARRDRDADPRGRAASLPT